MVLSAAPIVLLLTFLALIIIFKGADYILEYSPLSLLCSALCAVVLTFLSGSLTKRGLKVGLLRSARQIMPAVVMLIFIAMISTTWMLSGVVPMLIDYGLRILNPSMFLVTTCAVCGVISVLTGSSWSTIATIGVAFMGIGTIMGYNPGWIAGAIISGAYFGDKVSPLSDTTVVASSACGVDLFKHIRYLLITTVPAMSIALLVFLLRGITFDASPISTEVEILTHIRDTFNMSAWLFVIPAVTILLIVLRVPTLLTLMIGSAMGLAGIFIFQHQMLGTQAISSAASILWQGLSFDTGNELFDNLISTGGVLGMIDTIKLVLCAMIFGAALIGTGMLATLTGAITRRIHKRFSLVATTVSSGLFLNMCTADQYLSIIIGGNMFRNAYKRLGLEPRLLSRTVEDSVSVTSVLIPWNSCGVTQSTVLGVATLTYLPYCIFNYLSPVMTLIISLTGFKIRQAVSRQHAVQPSL